MGSAEMATSKRTKRPLWLNKFKANMIVRLVPFMLFLALLAIVYIYNGHRADSLVRASDQVQRLLKQKQYEYKALKADLMYRSKETELIQAVEPLGLIKPKTPPMVIDNKH